MKKFIKGYDYAYMITDKGRVYRSKFKIKDVNFDVKNLMLKEVAYMVQTDDFTRISLVKDGKQTIRPLQYLIAEAFIRNTNNYKFVKFIDGNKSNLNHLNLEWTPIRQRSSFKKKTKNNHVEKIEKTEKITCIFCRISNYFKSTKNN